MSQTSSSASQPSQAMAGPAVPPPQPGSGAANTFQQGAPPAQWQPAMQALGFPPNSVDTNAIMGMLGALLSNNQIMAAHGFRPGMPNAWSADGRGIMPDHEAPMRPYTPFGDVRPPQASGPAPDQTIGRAPGEQGAVPGPAVGAIDPALMSADNLFTVMLPDGPGGPGRLLTMSLAELQVWIKNQTRETLMEALTTVQTQRVEAEKHGEIPKLLQAAVHAEFRLLMGVELKARRGRGRKRAYVLPDPLKIGQPLRETPDHERIYNPEWELDVDVGVNAELVKATVKLVIDKAEEHHLTPAMIAREDDIKRAVTTYFNTLKRQYLADHDEEAGRRRQRKMTADMLHARRHRKADTLRVGVPAFRRAFGEEATEGIDELILTPWQSEEHSSDGEASADEREKYRQLAGVGPKALEIRQLTWRSPQLQLLYIVLGVFARFVRDIEDVEDVATAAAGVQQDPSSDTAQAARAAYLAKVIESAKDWRTVYVNSWQFLERFRGPPANARTKPHRDRKHKIYKECISEKWAAQSAQNAQIYANAPSCPQTFNVFGLEIPEALIPEDDLEYLMKLQESSEESGDEDGADDAMAED